MARDGGQTVFACPLFVQGAVLEEDKAGAQQLAHLVLVPNPSCDSRESLELFQFVGQLIGASVRSQKDKIAVDFAPFVWRRLAGQEATWADIAELEPELDRSLAMIQEATAEADFDQEFSGMNFSTSFSGARPYRQVELRHGGAAQRLSFSNRSEFVRLMKECHLRKYDTAIAAMRRGLLDYVPRAALQFYNGFELEEAAAGLPVIDVSKLRSEASVTLATAEQQGYFWLSVEQMSHQQRSKLLRFCTGRSRLPVGNLQVRSSGRLSDADLPTAATCSFELFLPGYSSQKVRVSSSTSSSSLTNTNTTTSSLAASASPPLMPAAAPPPPPPPLLCSCLLSPSTPRPLIVLV